MVTSRTSLVMVATLGSIVGLLAWLVLRPAFVAMSLRKDMAAMSSGHFDKYQLNQWAARHHGHVEFNGGDCSASATVYNRLLAAMHLAPLTMLTLDINVVDDTLVQSSLRLGQGDAWRGTAGATTSVAMVYKPVKILFPIQDWLLLHGPTGKPPLRWYIVTPHSNSGAIRTAFTLNPWCLARIGGCTAAQQSPEIWALPLSE